MKWKKKSNKISLNLFNRFKSEFRLLKQLIDIFNDGTQPLVQTYEVKKPITPSRNRQLSSNTDESNCAVKNLKDNIDTEDDENIVEVDDDLDLDKAYSQDDEDEDDEFNQLHDDDDDVEYGQSRSNLIQFNSKNIKKNLFAEDNNKIDYVFQALESFRFVNELI